MNSYIVKKVKEVYNASYSAIEGGYVKSEKPLLIVGPSCSGKLYAVKQLCYNKGKFPYVVGEIKTNSDLYGYIDKNGEYQASSVFIAYVTGQILYIRCQEEINKDLLKLLVKINNSKVLEFPCGKVKKGKGFKVVVAMYNMPKGITAKSIQENFTVINFGYDEKVERKLVKEKSLYDFLLAVRLISAKSKLPFSITTSTFKQLAQVKSIKGVEDSQIVASIVTGYGKDYVVKLNNALIKVLPKNKYVLQLSKMYGLNKKN